MKSLKLSHKIMVSLQLFPGRIKCPISFYITYKTKLWNNHIFPEQNVVFQGQWIVCIVAVWHVGKGIVVQVKY